jgi:predicted permease
MLLVSAGLMIRTFQELNNVNPGFAGSDQVQTFQIQIPQATARDPEVMARRQNDILDRLLALPGVTTAAYISDLPMSGGVAADLIVPEGKIFRPGEVPRSSQSRFVSPGVFNTLHVPLVKGRDLTWTDIYSRRPVALISASLARREWRSPDEALGKRLRGSSTSDAWREIIGVVGDVHDRGLNQPVTDTVYYPVFGERVYNNRIYVWPVVTYTIRSSRAGTAGFLDEVRKAVWSLDPNLPLVRVRTMGDVLHESMSRTFFTVVMLAIAGAMALLLGVIGIYGVIAYAVSQRAREVGIRIALGAEPWQVRRMFLQQGLALTAIGVAIGLAGAAALTRLMKSLLFEVSPLDAVTYAAVSVVLVLAAALATYAPTRRATRIDVIDSLRAE